MIGVIILYQHEVFNNWPSLNKDVHIVYFSFVNIVKFC